MSRPSLSESARLLRQRAELGGRDLFLDGLSREEALELVRAAEGARPLDGQVDSGGTAVPPGSASGASGGFPASPTPPLDPSTPAATPSESTRAGTSGGDLPTLPDDHDALREIARACTRCRLADGRTNVVFSDGPADARLMVVGEAPGANEDKTGLPFVGAAGKYLDVLLATVDLSRSESVYICNVLKCRPPGNRNPMSDEIELCSPFLEKQIDVVRPEALLAVGSFAAQLLTGREKTALGKLRGEVHAYHGVPLVVTYHPAALLRNPKWTRAFWDDLQLLRSLMNS